MKWWWVAAKLVGATVSAAILFLGGFGTGAVVVREAAQRSAAERIAVARVKAKAAEIQLSACEEAREDEAAGIPLVSGLPPDVDRSELKPVPGWEPVRVAPPLSKCEFFKQQCRDEW